MLLPVEPVRIGGWSLRFQLYSVPGQETYAFVMLQKRITDARMLISNR